ncbi:RNA-binding S4 domain-containing protein [Phenylobacterium sp.]|jgi:ribosomal 50S subunit-recycling heat shock protein|uniref:RNA-binding S4 domain-containing protein n=1 Tax=Phenylobacterium sp. TaxID=1871053 RepID=UPI002F423C0E
MSDETTRDAARADVWLWRARFFKTRSLAAKFVDEGRVRLTRAGHESRLDKCARPVKVGDSLVFALGGRLIAITVAGLGERRGPPAEARALYSTLEAP